MSEFRMPSLGADMEKGVLVEWNYKEGDRVKKGDIIALVETDKGLIDIEVFEDGIISEIRILPGQEVPVGEVLAVIGDEAGEIKRAGSKKTEPVKKAKKQKKERIRISPRARRLAEKLGVDIKTVQGSGISGTIDGDDVERAAGLKKPETRRTEFAEPGEEQRTDAQNRMRKAIAAAMSLSNREIPHYYLESSIDMTKSLRFLENENRKRSIRERFLPALILIKSVAHALRDVPELNGYWEVDQLLIKQELNIGFSVSLRKGGLINVSIRDADKKKPDEIREDLNDMITRARAGRIRSSDITDSTITLTYLGDMGAEVVYGVIYPPQVALVGFGSIQQRVMAHDGMIAVRPSVRVTLAADHRATDGVSGSRFLESLNEYLQEVEKIWTNGK